MTLAQSERAALVDTLRKVGPDAPTLCGDWDARALAAHLVIRERRPDAALGIMVSPLAGHTEKVQADTAAQPWPDLVEKVAEGPPWYSMFSLVDRWVNLAEMFIHHEDLLRGGADPDGPWTPRSLPDDMTHALGTTLKGMGRMTLRSLPARVTFVTPDGATALVAGSGPPVTATGAVGELLLFAYGRAPVVIDWEGDPDAIAAVKATTRSV
ncbi:TIGR03085 family metal-binding protein [Gordonia otitidis]|uniref:Mycothiol-dependent maleylpyruvate isomerase metal-binding domain-containing protein n=1 Tax=Gordonia otitidis (strain DSM 44809 / CCUG 52243 / JCM 12355 / NBRC 100426 / IFM 10032) TaxID=1108044 RepID=H5TK99_GORO1|nr:TIGR03085 family metal-binding protein [Gordonia otitidis]GAB33907.1 hypothetical protein GOOTI_087_00310 [Gordonia otitidis NBRC 100426]